jgi:3-oxoacyl-[acyl-carrier protein] reductase
MLKVLITGVASGIGKATKDYFINAGHFVYGIDVSEIEQEINLVSFKADITNKDELNKIYESIDEKIDLIINVAGIHKMASLVETDFDKIKKVIDINLVGTMLVNNTFHPLLKEKGRILIVTSEVAGFDPMPFNGLYNVSKTGLESYAQALRQELNLIDQKVITIRPGAIETPLASFSMDDTKALAEQTKLYEKQAGKFYNIARKFMGTPIKAEKIAKIIYKALGISEKEFLHESK